MLSDVSVSLSCPEVEVVPIQPSISYSEYPFYRTGAFLGVFEFPGGVTTMFACGTESPDVSDFVLVISVFDCDRPSVQHDTEAVSLVDYAEPAGETSPQRFLGPLKSAFHVRESDPSTSLYLNVTDIDPTRVVLSFPPAHYRLFDIVRIHYESMLFSSP